MAPIHDEELSYEHHIAEYRRMGLLREGGPGEAHWRAKAAQMQFYRVDDALSDLFVKTVALSGRLPEGVTVHSLRYGASRRLKIIWQGVRELHGVAPPDRRRPMTQEEVDIASRSLNDIYVHTIGTLDNYAYAIGAQIAPERFTALHPTQRTLFGSAFLKSCDSTPLRSLTEPFRAWANALMLLRNPVAHGIPLTVPPTIISKEVQAEHQGAWEAYQSAFNNPPPVDAPDRADAYAEWAKRLQMLMDRIESIGEFQPWIAHDPRAKVVPIYPTVLNDAGKLVVLCRALNRFLADAAGTDSETRSP